MSELTYRCYKVRPSAGAEQKKEREAEPWYRKFVLNCFIPLSAGGVKQSFAFVVGAAC